MAEKWKVQKWKAFTKGRPLPWGKWEKWGKWGGSLGKGADQGGNWTKGVSNIPSAGGVNQCHLMPLSTKRAQSCEGQ